MKAKVLAFTLLLALSGRFANGEAYRLQPFSTNARIA